MAHAVPPPAVHMTASQMKATARVQSEAMFEALKAAKLHTAMTDVRALLRCALASPCAAR
jgi:glyceraldehyde-3-phosphate dehydrogenase/erythrose-4-phosphate dehydrogenase